MVLEIDQGIGGCVLDTRKTMGRVPRLETAENNEFLKRRNFGGDFFGAQKSLK